MSSVAGLSKYIRTLPDALNSLLLIIVMSFIIGSVLFLVEPVAIDSGLENFLYGGAFGFVVFGLPAIITGSTDQFWVDTLKGINLKTKHSMFLAFMSMMIAGLVRNCSWSLIPLESIFQLHLIRISAGICIQCSCDMGYNQNKDNQFIHYCNYPAIAYDWNAHYHQFLK